MKFEQFLKDIEGASVLELNELVKAIEEKFGVSAAAVSAGPASGGAVAEEAEAKSAYDVIRIGDNYISTYEQFYYGRVQITISNYLKRGASELIDAEVALRKDIEAYKQENAHLSSDNQRKSNYLPKTSSIISANGHYEYNAYRGKRCISKKHM